MPETFAEKKARLAREREEAAKKVAEIVVNAVDEREECPHCNKPFKNLKAHLKKCKLNPENEEPEPKAKAQETSDWETEETVEPDREYITQYITSHAKIDGCIDEAALDKRYFKPYRKGGVLMSYGRDWAQFDRFMRVFTKMGAKAFRKVIRQKLKTSNP